MIRTKADQEALDQGFTYDDAAGQRVIDFVQTHLVLETGKPFTLLEWQKEFINEIFCWKRPDGLRRFKTVFLTCAKKNGKSILLAALTAYMLLADGEMSPLCVSCAVNREQATIIYDSIQFAISRNPKLKKVTHTTPSKKEITYPSKNGKYKSLSADVASKHGANCSLVVYDELAFHPKDELYNTLKYSSVSRPNGLQIIISTAGHNKNGCFYTLYRYAKAILDGTETDLTFLPFIYETPQDADLEDESNWHKSNPSLGISQSISDFKNDWRTAKFDSSETLNFKKLRFNQWIDAVNVWIPLPKWDACKSVLPSLLKRTCYLGADLGATQDLTAVVAVFPIDGKFYVKSIGFVPEAAVKKRDKQNLVKYDQFTLDGGLKITKGEATDFPNLKRYIFECRNNYNVVSVTLDRWNAMQLANELMADGMTVFQFPQTHSYMNEPTKALERLVLEGNIVHTGDSLLRWQIGHTLLDMDGKGLVKPMTNSEHQKKDNLIALVMALSQAIQHEQHETMGKSVYEERGILCL